MTDHQRTRAQLQVFVCLFHPQNEIYCKLSTLWFIQIHWGRPYVKMDALHLVLPNGDKLTPLIDKWGIWDYDQMLTPSRHGGMYSKVYRREKLQIERPIFWVVALGVFLCSCTKAPWIMIHHPARRGSWDAHTEHRHLSLWEGLNGFNIPRLRSPKVTTIAKPRREHRQVILGQASCKAR